MPVVKRLFQVLIALESVHTKAPCPPDAFENLLFRAGTIRVRSRHKRIASLPENDIALCDNRPDGFTSVYRPEGISSGGLEHFTPEMRSPPARGLARRRKRRVQLAVPDRVASEAFYSSGNTMEYLYVLSDLGGTVSLSREVTVDARHDAPALFLHRTAIPVPPGHERLFPHILALRDAAASLDVLCDEVAERHSIGGMTQFYRLLHHLATSGALTFAIPGTMELVPGNSRFAPGKPALTAGTRYRLSRFSFIRNNGDGPQLESALHPVRATLLDGALQALLLGSGGFVPEDLDAYPPEQRTRLRNALLLLLGYMLLIPDGAEQESLKYWEFHDLLLHARSRAGGQTAGFGPTYRFREAPPPAVRREPAERPVVALDKPDMDRWVQAGPPFFALTENRFSHRAYSDEPMPLDVLSALLYLSSRIKTTYDCESYQATTRPYPGGGALYELELYVTVTRCQGLEAGMYHYLPDKHALALVSPETARTERLRREAATAAQCGDFHALLSIGARFDRVMWKYEALAYSLILKDCGVFMHNFCLACSALGLGSCILGSGSSSLLPEITGEDPFLEAAVGELVFGVPASPPSSRPRDGDLP